MRPRKLFVAVVLGGLLTVPVFGYAQEVTIIGKVTDSTEAVLPGVTVTAVHNDTGNTFVSVTDATGEYRLSALRTGVYTLTAELAGFAPVKQANIELLLGQRAVTNFKLTLSTVQESVTVTAEVPLLNTTQSRIGGNVDTRQLQELPVNGRNWLDLTMLAPGSRVNSVGGSDAAAPVSGGAGQTYQLNVDGQQVTYMMNPGSGAQPRFSRDSIAEFELITNRFDASQGRSMGVQVNAVTKSGTNRFAGSASSYFRDDRFNAADFILRSVLPYSNQQVAWTLGGPIRQDRMHFFVNDEYEREPQTTTFTSPYPRFNNAVEWSSVARHERKSGGRFDAQFSPRTRLSLRASRYTQDQPVTSVGATAADSGTRHPSTNRAALLRSHQVYGTVLQVLGQSVVHELKAGYSFFNNIYTVDPGVATAPLINLRGYRIGKDVNSPQDIRQHNAVVRDDLTFLLHGAGRHEFKVGGEFMYNLTDFINWPSNRAGTIDATGGAVPSNIEALFPVWNDPSTWNLAALSPITRSVTQAFGTFHFSDPKKIGAAWLQDNWAVMPRLILNLGLRYDVSIGSLAEHLTLPPFLPATRPSDTLNFQPRLGFAYTLPDTRTVLRGGWGKYFTEPTDAPQYSMNQARQTTTVTFLNDGRPDFAANPYNGPPPATYEEASKYPLRGLKSFVSNDYHTPYSWQSSIGFQRQLGDRMAVEADYVYVGSRRVPGGREENLTYNPATGANNRFSVASLRLYPEWASVSRSYTDGKSNYHGLQTAVTKRLSQRWQGSASYTLSGFWDADGVPQGDLLRCQVPGSGVVSACPAGFTLAPDLGGEYTLAATDQRHRAVFNGIWEVAYGFQLSGLYFFGSGQRFGSGYGTDLRDRGIGAAGRLRPDGTIMPKNDVVGTPLHRLDLRVLRSFRLRGSMKVDGIFEVFNLFNHENYGSFVTTETSPIYRQPQQNRDMAYQPRMLQLGFRFVF